VDNARRRRSGERKPQTAIPRRRHHHVGVAERDESGRVADRMAPVEQAVTTEWLGLQLVHDRHMALARLMSRPE